MTQLALDYSAPRVDIDAAVATIAETLWSCCDFVAVDRRPGGAFVAIHSTGVILWVDESGCRLAWRDERAAVSPADRDDG